MHILTIDSLASTPEFNGLGHHSLIEALTSGLSQGVQRKIRSSRYVSVNSLALYALFARSLAFRIGQARNTYGYLRNVSFLPRS